MVEYVRACVCVHVCVCAHACVMCMCVVHVCACADAPWCGHCQKLAPAYAEAATKLKGAELAGIRLAKVEASEEQELAEEFDVASFPTLRLFVDGDRKNSIEYTGKQTVSWLSTSQPKGCVFKPPRIRYLAPFLLPNDPMI